METRAPSTVNVWQPAASIKDGPLLRSVNKVGKVGESLGDWSVVTESAKQTSIEHFVAHDLRRPVKLCQQGWR